MSVKSMKVPFALACLHRKPSYVLLVHGLGGSEHRVEHRDAGAEHERHVHVARLRQLHRPLGREIADAARAHDVLTVTERAGLKRPSESVRARRFAGTSTTSVSGIGWSAESRTTPVIAPPGRAAAGRTKQQPGKNRRHGGASEHSSNVWLADRRRHAPANGL